MPTIRPLSDFNRNQTKVIDELERTGEPIYLTRNGEAAVVVMDATAFDRAMSFKEQIAAHEVKVYGSLMKGYSDYADGKVDAAEDVEARIRAQKGWS